MITKLNEEVAIYEYDVFGCTANEYKEKIQKKLKECHTDYKIDILPFNARKEINWYLNNGSNAEKTNLDKNYTYTIGTTYKENGNYIRLLLYVSLLKDDNEHSLFVYNNKAIMYRNVTDFPSKYDAIINNMLNVIEQFRI